MKGRELPRPFYYETWNLNFFNETNILKALFNLDKFVNA